MQTSETIKAVFWQTAILRRLEDRGIKSRRIHPSFYDDVILNLPKGWFFHQFVSRAL